MIIECPQCGTHFVGQYFDEICDACHIRDQNMRQQWEYDDIGISFAEYKEIKGYYRD